MSPLVKNTGLAFLAALVTSLSVALQADIPNDRAAAYAVGAAAVYAGIRAAVGYLKVYFTGETFAVDTEA